MIGRRPQSVRVAVLGASIALTCLLCGIQGVNAYPDFQAFSQKKSGRYVDCAMCHLNHDGPVGIKPGQIGGLTADEKQRLDDAKDALDPGQDVNSPILNDFGNHIIKTLGRLKFIELQKTPAGLSDALGFTSDLDNDGIPDAREYLEGTHPLNAQSGDPWRLFRINLRRSVFPIVMTLLAIVFGLYGLNNAFNGLSRLGESAERRKKSPSGGERI